MTHLNKAYIVLRRRGVGYLWYLLTGYLIPKFIYYLFYQVPRSRLRTFSRGVLFGLTVGMTFTLTQIFGLMTAIMILIVMISLWFLLKRGIQALQILRMKRQVCQLAEQARSSWKDDSFTSWDQWPVETPTRERIETHRKERPNEEIVIGRIDNDGHVLGLFGPLPGLQNIAKEEFVTPYRFPLEVVLIEDKILIRKDFRGRRAPFIREWHNLTLLNAKANVPPVFCVDERRCVLYKNFIPGSTIRARLARAGARILNKQTDQDPELAHLDGQERLYAILARGSALISKCLAPDVVTEMEHQIEAIHRCGVAGLSLTFGNLIVDENRVPWFLDFEGARAFPSTHHPLFVLSRDKDRALFNRIYGRNLLTEKSAREASFQLSQNGTSWYAPIDFGSGLTLGGFWLTDSGTGRWEFINKQVLEPLLVGKRVLDLGSNNGVMPLMMLRAGAKEVIGLELSAMFVERSKLVHRIFEWRDLKPYDFKVHTCNMLNILKTGWSKFDLITAFCSLYYLAAEDMARVVRRSSELAPIMVLQAKTDTRSSAPENKAEKSSIKFLKNLLIENGFPNVEVFAPKNYSRPLLVGRTISH